MPIQNRVRLFGLLMLMILITSCGGGVTDIGPKTPPDTIVRTLVANPPKVTIETGGAYGLPSCKGREVVLGVQAKNAAGALLSPQVSWTSSDPALIPVDPSTGKAKSQDIVGKVTAIATTNGLSAPVEVEVVRTVGCRDTVVAIIVLASDMSVLTVDGGKRQVSARVFPDSADPSGAWSSSVPGVLSVDANGLVSGASEGFADICFTSSNKKKGCQSFGSRYPAFILTPKKVNSNGVVNINMAGTGCPDTSMEIASSIPAIFVSTDLSVLSVSQVNDTSAVVRGVSASAARVRATDRYGRVENVIVGVSNAKCP